MSTSEGVHDSHASPGPYELRAEAQGFKQYVHSGSPIGSNTRAGQDILLQLGSSAESVIVTDQAAALKKRYCVHRAKVRRKEHKTLKAAGDDRSTGTRYDWLRNPVSMEPKDRKEFAELRNRGLKTARAWALKETLMAL